MKAYPRIYSLTTLGIRQHQHFEYRFHPFRTDFVGDSGSGKSMIADMLQLIFVGSEAWMSPTEATERRTVDGMVLRTASRGTEIAYMFLNLEVEQEEYVIVGAYLESSSENTRSFIIHKSFDENILESTAEPLAKATFLKDKTILPLDELKHHLESQNLVLHTYSRKKFHKVLFDNNILMLDMSSNERLLRDYAMIIQSFSRGKVLEINRSDSLKAFLFGHTKGKEFARLFRQAEDEMRATINDYSLNKAEIEQVVQKHKALLELQRQQQERDAAKKDWLTSNCRFANQEVRFQFEKLQGGVKSHVVAKQRLVAIQRVLMEYVNALDEELAQSNGYLENAKANYESYVPQWEGLKSARELVTKLGIPAGRLSERYIENKTYRRKQELLDRVDPKLKNAGLEILSIEIANYSTNAELLETLHQLREQFRSDLEEKERYLEFANMRDERSLGYWALKEGRALTDVEESILMHFKSTRLSQPANPSPGDKYIPDPLRLLKEAIPTSITEEGFWTTFGGIREYITLVKEQKFTALNIEGLDKVLKMISEGVSGEIESIKRIINAIDSVKEVILAESDFNEYLQAARDRTQVRSYEHIEALDKGIEEVHRMQHLLSSSMQIEAGYSQSHLVFWDLSQSISNRRFEKVRLTKEGEKLELILSDSQWTDRLQSVVDQVRPHLEIIDDLRPVVADIEKMVKISADPAKVIYDEIEDQRPKLNSLTIIGEFEEYQKKIKVRDEVWRKYQSTYMADPEFFGTDKEFQSDPSGKERVFQVLKEVFERSFLAVIDQFQLKDSYKLKDEFSLVVLSHMLLPEAFKEVDVHEEAIITTIESYLKKINEKNRELSKRKLQKIHDVLEKVRDEISLNVDFARRIDLFLNRPESEITGGNRARLKLEFSREFPKVWIDNFSEKLQQEGTLFQDVSIAEQLAESISLQDKLFQAFQLCGGSYAIYSLEKLLDPNSYVDLNFLMESILTGRSNKGSSGQTYAAVALLCIARMSLIDKDAGSKRRKGIRFMPIDEAEGLGSNYDMLYSIAKKFDYQIISMSINPLGRFVEGDQYLYMLHKNTDSELDVNNEPFAVLQNYTNKENTDFANGQS
ncbi:hypothetical protein EPD60_07500 [Flaviaesturariibacter flavus]|uniref:MukB N-terminal domain-containing protein n=1 Tax=Flaviaesturariibacter flavus TaxID=2502780 RepID=A0A4R1BHJ0_9BACT|nr:hypothetical protein [Flaviaesturariibacter flavus]TCJ16578.1 hypothetical protein EPD60_07500 [Flaviaesturariibacter flavus]